MKEALREFQGQKAKKKKKRLKMRAGTKDEWQDWDVSLKEESGRY